MDREKFLEVLTKNSEFAFGCLGLRRKMESPIEQLFACAFWSRHDLIGVSEIGSFSSLDEMERCAECEAPKVVWSPQVDVSGFRVDFLFCQARAGRERPMMVAVECDGHAFHEKTKEQAARDKARDRKLAAHGVIVLRFTGAEIYRDATACAVEVHNLLADEWHESMRRHHPRKYAEVAGCSH